MRDAAEMMSALVLARVKREMDESECKRRNALSKTSPGFVLRPGDVGTVVETFGTNEAFLVEFNKNGHGAANSCDWMGVLYPAEIEVSQSSSDKV
jgi:hypothetical protein